MEIKLGDFGLAAKLEFDNEKRHTVCGTPNYLAPEILENKTGHTYGVDIWSLGVVIYTLVVGRPPFETPDVKSTYKKIKMCAYSFPEHIPLSDNVKNLISKILQLDPAKRPTLDDIMRHPFLNNGKGIPRYLPLSTLACPPSKNYLNQFIAMDDGKDDKGSEKGDIGPGKSQATKQESKPTVKDSDTGAATGASADVYVRKWVDYSTKYGLGYLLSNGFSGVFFNDCTKIVLDPSKE